MPDTAEEVRLTRLEQDVEKIEAKVDALAKFQAWFGGGFGIVAAIILAWLNKHGISFE